MLVVSPHFDDAALSLGGTIALAALAGEAPLVVTVFAGAPHRKRKAGPLARWLHREWGLGRLSPASVVARRMEEDAAAARVLGATLVWLDHPDLIYRDDRLTEIDQIFGPLWPEDRALVDHVARDLAMVWRKHHRPPIYLPLGIGAHRDHRICAALLARFRRAGAEVFAYEDLPYAVETPLEKAPKGRTPRRVDITRVFGRKIEAVECYRSQVGGLFRGTTPRRALGGYARALAGAPRRFAERVWR